jgi:hypothetical protein
MPPAQFWYGTPTLWTALRPDGTWRGLPYQDGVYTQKVFWWHKEYVGSQPRPLLTVTGKRIDGSAGPLLASTPSPGFNDDVGSFVLVLAAIPSAGCWEITGHEEGTSISFVVWVEPTAGT